MNTNSGTVEGSTLSNISAFKSFSQGFLSMFGLAPYPFTDSLNQILNSSSSQNLEDSLTDIRQSIFSECYKYGVQLNHNDIFSD